MAERGLRRSLGWFVGLVTGMGLALAELAPGASAASLAIVLGMYPQLLYGLSGRRVAHAARPWWGRLGFSGARRSEGQSADGQSADVGTREAATVVEGAGTADLGSGVTGMAWGVGALTALLVAGGPPYAALAADAVVPRAFWFAFLAVAIPLVAARSNRWSTALFAMLLLGAWAGRVFVGIEFVQIGTAPASVFVGALLGAAALLVPGGFGSTVLRASGLIDHAVAAFGNRDIGFLAPFATGLAAGIVLAAFALHHLLRRFPEALPAFLLGVMCSGLPRAWPWQRVDAYTLTVGGDSVAVATTPLWPWHYFAATGADASNLQAGVVMFLAALLAWRMARGRGYAARP